MDDGYPNHSYAILRLQDASATVGYYEVSWKATPDKVPPLKQVLSEQVDLPAA